MILDLEGVPAVFDHFSEKFLAAAGAAGGRKLTTFVSHLLPIEDVTSFGLQYGVGGASVPSIRRRFGEQIGVSQIVAKTKKFVTGARRSNDGEFFPKRQEERRIARVFGSADEENLRR